MSILRAMGAKDAGLPTMLPVIWVTPMGIPMTAVIKIPKRIDPRTPLAMSTAVMSSPIRASAVPLSAKLPL